MLDFYIARFYLDSMTKYHFRSTPNNLLYVLFWL